MSGANQTRQQRLSSLSLFAGVPPADLGLVAETGRWELVPAGGVVMREGEDGSDLLVVVSGRFQVAVGQGPARVVLANVGPGELLGEAVLFRRSVTRSAEVVAVDESTVLRFTNAELEALNRVGNGLPRAIEEVVLRTLARRILASRELVTRMLKEEEAPSSSGGLFSRLRGLIG